jgi:ribokinase
MMDVVVAGSLNMDLVVQVERMPAPGETLRGSDLQTIPGGKGANQAAAACRLGCEVAMIGRVGADAFGPRLKRNLQDQGVNVEYVQVDDQTASGTALILVERGGENSIVISPGANGRFSAQDIQRSRELIESAGILLLQFEVPLEAIQAAVQAARQSSVQVILNPAPAQAVPPELLAQVDILAPNESELQTLTGMKTDTLQTVKQAARKLLDLGVPVVIVTLGAQGALLATRKAIQLVPGVPVETVDTTAAGDAFIGGLASALLQERPLQQAVLYANCAGALATTKFGAQPSLPSAAEVNACFQNRGQPA